MSQIRKIRRHRSKQQKAPEKAKKTMLWLIVIAVTLVIIVAYLGFRNISTAPTPDVLSESESETIPESLQEPELLLTASSGEVVTPAGLMASAETGSIFVFFLGAG
jgi:flagellar basal body-associated protein FliL